MSMSKTEKNQKPKKQKQKNWWIKNEKKQKELDVITTLSGM